MSWWCKGSTLSRHASGLGFDSRVRTLFSIDLCCIYLVFTMLFIFVKRMYSLTWCSVHGLVPYSFLTLIGRAPPVLNLRSYNILFTCVSYCRIMHEKTYISCWCKCSTLSRHVKGLGFDSRVRTLFSIDLCCIYLVFTMLFFFVKRMYS